MTKPREIGWAIKMSTEEKYLVGPAGGWWTDDIGQAILCLRQNDARRLLEALKEVATVDGWGSPQHVVVERVVPAG